MSEKSGGPAIHREFELERMILFSDAVFAIAITLLIIEIKFPELPENYKKSLDLFNMFWPTILQLLGFFLSFYFIGITWAGHLKIFRYLKGYDNGVIFRNLFSLLFVVTIPFSASGLMHARPSFMFPLILYMGNVTMIAISNFMLSHYIFRKKSELSIVGHEPEKKFMYLQSKVGAVIFGTSFLIVVAVAVLSGMNNAYIMVSFYILPISFIISKRWIRKYRPKKGGKIMEDL